jgi:predicted methyltransferase
VTTDPGSGARQPALDQLLSDVAHAVGLQEGRTGVRQVLRSIHRLGRASTRSVSQQAGLPLPVVAAVNNELRARGILTTDRPSQLTPQGLAMLGDAPADLGGEVECAVCQGSGLTLPAGFPELHDRLAALAAQAPAADMTLDQTHCTAATKLRRVLFLLRSGLLPGPDLLLVGDDDLIALTIATAADALGRPLVGRLAVVDVSAEILAFTRAGLDRLGARADLVEQDLRGPLDDRLRGGFSAAMTDPPYTVEGARLFLSRAVEGLAPGPGHSIAFSFGPKGPDETLRVQKAVTRLGLAVQEMRRDFNEYAGAGVIGGRSHLYHLVTTARTAPVVAGEYTGPLYTADKRAANRAYLCTGCRTRHAVGPGARWASIAALKAAGCPVCGGDRLRPLQLIRAGAAP